MATFGEVLKAMRETRGWTVNQLGMYSGVSGASISRYETGERNPPKPPTIRKIADALKLKDSYEQLMKAAGYIEETEVEHKLTEIEMEKLKLIQMIKDLPDPQRKLVEELVRSLHEK